MFRKKCKPPYLYLGTSQLAQSVATINSFRNGPRPPVWAAHQFLQFMPWILQNLLHAAFPLRMKAHEFRVADFLNKEDPESDAIMAETLRVVLYPPRTVMAVSAPIVVCLPGLACNSLDLPGQHTLKYAESRGYRCAVMERRGQWRSLESARFNVFGDARDLEFGIRKLQSLCPDAPLFIAGISAGSALAISAVGKFDARRKDGDHTAPSFIAVGDLFPGFDISPGGCMNHAQAPFDRIMLGSMKGFFVEKNAAVLRAFDSKAYHAAMDAQSCDAFLSAAAPFAGYPSGREAYDAAENPVRFVEAIDTPVLIILAADDPISVLSNFTDVQRGSLQNEFNEQYKWTPAVRLPHLKYLPTTANTVVCVANSGSHCPMLDGYIFPVRPSLATLASWHDEALLDFFDHVWRNSLDLQSKLGSRQSMCSR